MGRLEPCQGQAWARGPKVLCWKGSGIGGGLGGAGKLLEGATRWRRFGKSKRVTSSLLGVGQISTEPVPQLVPGSRQPGRDG